MIGRTILSLCDYSGAWPEPYRLAGYDVITVDLDHGLDVRLMEHIGMPIHGILAAPPCTYFARSGARWRKEKGEQALLESLAIVDACLRAVAIYRPTWWALENPIGCLNRWLGPSVWSFDPCDFGDAYTKKTHLWGHFTPPMPLWSGDHAVEPVVSCPQGSWLQQLGGTSTRTKRLRSRTPDGFSNAFFKANP